jgi:hypothetical protein
MAKKFRAALSAHIPTRGERRNSSRLKQTDSFEVGAKGLAKGAHYWATGQAFVLANSGVTFERIGLSIVSDRRFRVILDGVQLSQAKESDAFRALLAGPIAERMSLDDWNLACDDEGMTKLASRIARIPFGNPAQKTGRAWEALCATEETCFELWSGWPTVTQLVKKLDECGTLTMADVLTALNTKYPRVRPKPLVPKADEILSELDIILRQNHRVELGDWRACRPQPRSRWRTSVDTRHRGGPEPTR